MLEYPPQLSYSHHHMWAAPDEKTGLARVGVTPDLIEELDEIMSIDLPMVDDELEMDCMCVHLHLDAEIHHLYSPLSGRVTRINRDVLDDPDLLHVNPFENWLYEMEFDEIEELDFLMSDTQYISFLDNL